MSTDYSLVCYTCESKSPLFASASISYGFKVWLDSPGENWLKWLGHRKDVGAHEGHDLRIVSEHVDLPWDNDETKK